jgi:hypothetical protein
VGCLFGTFSAVGRIVTWDVFRVGPSVPWRVGRFKSWTFSDGTFLEWDVSRAGPFAYAPHVHTQSTAFLLVFLLDLQAGQLAPDPHIGNT